MDALKEILPLLGVLVGAAISGVSHLYKSWQERKRSIAVALTDLLEVRHHMAGIKEVLLAFKQRYKLPAEFDSFIYDAIEQTSPINPELHKRYESSVSMLSGYDPLLAFYLRSKSTAPHLVSSVKGLGSAGGMEASALGELSNTLMSAIAPAMDQAVLKLAAAHSWRTRRKVAEYLKKSSGLAPEANELFAQLEKLFKQLQEGNEGRENLISTEPTRASAD